MDSLKSIKDIDFAALTRRKYTPSPECWSDQVLYFLLVDRFSNGQECGGHKDNRDNPVTTGSTPPATSDNLGTVSYEQWLAEAEGWQGGTLKGLRSKLGYLRRLGVTAIWISPVFKQVSFEPTYHGYGIQNFLDIDPHFGTREELRDLVDEAHAHGIYCILDVILNHAGNVFEYKDARYTHSNGNGESVPDARWDGQPYGVAGFRDSHGEPVIPFDQPHGEKLGAAWPDGAIWPRELQSPKNFMQMGRIANWDFEPEFKNADICSLKKLNLNVDWSEKYPRPSSTMMTLAVCYFYWVAYADIDGFRIDAVKHMGKESTRFFCSALHEMAQTIGKERFFMAGEVTGGRRNAWSMVDSTGLDAALGIEDIPGKVESMVKGYSEPREYFDLFRNSPLDDHGDFAWYGQHVINMFDDHDQVRKGAQKRRFCGTHESRDSVFNALAVNMTTCGIPCIYYGTEQGFDSGGRPAPIDTVLRENMFGGRFGSFCSQNVHFFNEDTKLYQAIARLGKLRSECLALRRGRQFVHEVSGDGVNFGYPAKFGEKFDCIVTWSRVMGDHEMLVAFNTDEKKPQEIYSTLNPNERKEGDRLELVFSYSPERGAEPLDSPQYAWKSLKVERRGNNFCTRLSLGPAGFAIYSAGKVLEIRKNKN